MMDEYENKLLYIQTEINNFSKKYNKKIKLVVVSKSQNVHKITKILNLGYKVFGENYLDEAINKQRDLTKDYNIEWHFIGNIQSNKIKKIVNHFDWIQTVSSEKHAILIDKSCKKLSKIINICVQINIDNEESKSGIHIKDLGEFIKKISMLDNIKIRGLMAIPSKLKALKEDENSYSMLKLTFDSLKSKIEGFDTLSIGMSNDFKMALNNGSNMIRIGSYIFGERKDEK
jgi:hypothetical protein